jgi:endonuclease/exonuclease/phosphatase family metal-dependent hydrolase
MGQILRVLSANLWNGGAEPEALAELVESTGADVVCLQELAPEQAEELCWLLPHGRLEPDSEYLGIGTLTRLPSHIERLPLSWHDAHRIRLEPGDWPGLLKPLEILNLHIAAPHIKPYPVGLLHRRRQLRDLEGYLDAEARDARIDHAFCQGLRAEDFRVLPIRGSDHSAIVVDFALD